ncbi:MAG TPA: hypothetical protein VIL91_04340 [Gaiellaceae bacterium]|jgi:hypothetical protein
MEEHESRAVLESLTRILDELRSMVEILQPEVEADEGASADWSTFVAEHPELAQTAPLRFTDDELVAAVPEAIRQWNEYWAQQGTRWVKREPFDYIWSSSVAALLAVGHVRAPVAKGDVVRVGRALARLSRAGLVRRVERKWEGTARWQPVGGGDDA